MKFLSINIVCLDDIIIEIPLRCRPSLINGLYKEWNNSMTYLQFYKNYFYLYICGDAPITYGQFEKRFTTYIVFDQTPIYVKLKKKTNSFQPV